MRLLQPGLSTFCILLSGAAHAAPGDGLTILDAVRTTLAKSPTLKSGQENVNAAKGRKKAAAGQFDWVLESNVGHARQHTPFAADVSQRDDVTSLGVGLSKKFRWGMTVTPSVQLTRTDTVLPGQTTTATAQNGARISFQVVQPLLRGFGSASDAEERAESHFHQASVADFEHAVSARVFAVAQLYWGYRAAVETVAIHSASEARAKRLLGEMQALVDADQRPAADLAQVKAILADRSRDRTNGELQLRTSKYELGVEMGLSPTEIESIGSPVTSFPAVVPVGAKDPLVDRAMKLRRDAEAAQLRIHGAAALLEGTANALKPQLDLAGGVGYSGVDGNDKFHRLFAPIGTNVAGLDASLSLLFRWPILNSAASGVHGQAAASHRQAEIERDDLLRTLSANVKLAVAVLEQQAAVLSHAENASSQFRTAVFNEEKKLKEGLSTLIDVIFSEDRLTSAQLAEIFSRVQYAQSLLRVRFESGTLVRGYESGGAVDENSLKTFPELAQP